MSILVAVRRWSVILRIDEVGTWMAKVEEWMTRDESSADDMILGELIMVQVVVGK